MTRLLCELHLIQRELRSWTTSDFDLPLIRTKNSPCDIFVLLASRLTLGREALEPELCVVMVSTVVMPSPTLAGAASMFIQKDTQDRMTMSSDGMYIWIK